MKIKSVLNKIGAAFFAVLISTQSAGADAPTTLVQPADSTGSDLQQAYQLYGKNDLEAAQAKASEYIKYHSRDKEALILRATIYAKQHEWDKADLDYNVASSMDPTNTVIKFDLAEILFMQKKYDDARRGFIEIENDKDLGDFATYKVFLCDLFGAHEDVAAKELDALNEVGGNPSYYFGNAAWDLVHKKQDEASDWLKSASRIYAGAPEKITNYTASLQDLGYLPLNQTTATQ